MKSRTSLALILAVVCSGAVLAEPMWAQNASATLASPAAAPPSTRREAVEHAQGLSAAFRSASEAVLPAVVRITSTTKARQVRRSAGQGENPFGGRNPLEGTPFEDLFGEELRGQLGQGFQQLIPEQRGAGSGVIIDKKGLVLTNNHVVEGADEVIIELSDGRQLKASDIRRDKLTDLAILKIESSEPFPAAELGDSDALQIGDWVLAVGQPFELGVSVSAGIISAKERTLSQVERASFLQTDAAVNPGNSGGPLVNLEGKVVGINTAIATRSGGYQGISFAVPINSAKWVIERLVEDGAVNRAYLGVGIQELTPEYAGLLNLPRGTRGVHVNFVQNGRAADRAGVQVQDVIVGIAGKRVTSPKDLQRIVEQLPVGSDQEIEILRGGETRKLKVKLDTYEGRVEEVAEDDKDRETIGQNELGLEVEELTDDVAEQLGFVGKRGALVTNVERSGIAAQSGLRPGVLVVRVGQSAITDVESLQKAVEGIDLEQGVFVTVLIPGAGGQAPGTQVILLKNR